jgi:hypothetical protein
VGVVLLARLANRSLATVGELGFVCFEASPHVTAAGLDVLAQALGVRAARHAHVG